MKNRNWKADEMEMEINFRSIRIAYVFSLFALLIYCIFELVTANELMTIPFVILCVQCTLFFASKVYLTKKMVSGNGYEE